MAVPDSLNQRFELFRSSGRFFKHDAQELFAEESWVQVLLGQGFEMRADPVTSFVPDDELADFLQDLAQVIEDVATEMPDHGEFIQNLPPSMAAASANGAITTNFALTYGRGAA